MEFDVQKIQAFYERVVAERDNAVRLALAETDAIVEERFELAKAEIEEKVIAEITANAEQPYLHDIQLCETFLADPEEENDTVSDENENEIEIENEQGDE